MPTLSAKNHIDVLASGTVKTFPKTAQKMLDPIPLTPFGADGYVAPDHTDAPESAPDAAKIP